MTPADFIAAALPWARIASRSTGVAVAVILAQWADETAWGGPDWSPRNNPGNVGDTEAGGQVTFPTLAAGVTAYINTMELAYYDAVRAAPGPQSQAIALGESPWAAGHYGNPPGSDLLAIMAQYNLYQYDAVASSPPEPREGDEMTAVVIDGKVVSYVNVGGHYVEVVRSAPGVAAGGGNTQIIDLTAAFPAELTGVTN